MKNSFNFEAKVIANKLEELAKMKPVPKEYGLPIFATDTLQRLLRTLKLLPLRSG